MMVSVFKPTTHEEFPEIHEMAVVPQRDDRLEIDGQLWKVLHRTIHAGSQRLSIHIERVEPVRRPSVPGEQPMEFTS